MPSSEDKQSRFCVENWFKQGCRRVIILGTQFDAVDLAI